MKSLFWLSVTGIVFVYFGYPLVLAVAAALRRRKPAAGDYEPAVSILISAFDEELSIGATIENKLALNYPADKREIIVVSDGSTDATESIVQTYAGRGVRLIVQPVRQGKTAALNRAVREASGEIIVFSDANSIYDRDALRKVVRNFADPEVGYVTGKMVYVDETGSLVGGGCSAYMRYENALRSLETKAGSVVGVDGGIDAVRKKLYEPMRPDLLPDFVLPLSVVDKGFRVVYEPEAILMEHTLSTVQDEMRMRVRVILRSFHALWFMRHLFNPIRFGFFSFQLFTHKLLRYMAGFLQVTAFASNYALALSEPAYRGLLAAQVAFYVVSATGYVMRDRSFGPFRYAYYFCLLNAAATAAFWKFVRGERQVIWQPRKGN